MKFLVSFPSYFWQPGVYYQDRVAVFTTIIALIMAGIAVLGLHGCRNSLRGYKKNWKSEWHALTLLICPAAITINYKFLCFMYN